MESQVSADGRLPAPTLAAISQALNDGDVVAVFPEGEMSRDGRLRPFAAWVGQVFGAHPRVPVVPLVLHGLWDSVFSGATIGFLDRLRKARFSRVVTISGGQSVCAGMTDHRQLHACALRLAEAAQS